MSVSKKERERVREAISKSLTASPKRQQEIIEMMKRRLGAEDINSGQTPKGVDGCVTGDKLEEMRSHEPSCLEQEVFDEIGAGKFLDGFTETSGTGDISALLPLRRLVDVEATERET
jgi:hypothetical protein